VSEQNVITGEAPKRYASALLELATEAKSLNSIEKDVKSLTKMFKDSADLNALANNPVYATEQKVAAMMAVAKKAKVGKLTSQFVGTVVQNRRADQLPSILASFQEQLAAQRGTQVARVTSAAKLSAADLSALKAKLKKSAGKTVTVETTVDPDLLGGFVVQIGSRLYDNSLKTKLEDLRLALKDA
jgi:F-type H+-transporting ATPase subunit delta